MHQFLVQDKNAYLEANSPSTQRSFYLGLNEASEQIVSGAKVVTTNGKKWVKWADVVIYQGIVLEHFRQLRKGKKFLIADMYDPLHIEYLGSAANTSMYVRRAVLSVTAASIGLQMRLSDLILAASPNQVSLWQFLHQISKSISFSVIFKSF